MSEVSADNFQERIRLFSRDLEPRIIYLDGLLRGIAPRVQLLLSEAVKGMQESGLLDEQEKKRERICFRDYRTGVGYLEYFVDMDGRILFDGRPQEERGFMWPSNSMLKEVPRESYADLGAVALRFIRDRLQDRGEE